MRLLKRWFNIIGDYFLKEQITVLRWLKVSGVSLACDKNMRKLSNEITGNSLIGEIAPFSFPLASGREELKEAALVYIPDLVTKVTQMLDDNER